MKKAPKELLDGAGAVQTIKHTIMYGINVAMGGRHVEMEHQQF